MKGTELFQKFGKPCTVGCIDGTHVPILRPPQELEDSYLNRKVFHSLNVLVSYLLLRFVYLHFIPQ